MSGRDEFLSGTQSLAAVVQAIDDFVSSGVRVQAERQAVGSASLTIIHGMLMHARAMLSLAPTDCAGASAAHLRPLFEGWISLELLLHDVNDVRGTEQYQIAALLDRLDYLRASEAVSGEIERLETVLASHRVLSPDVVKDTETIGSGVASVLVEPWNDRPAASDNPEQVTAARALLGGGSAALEHFDAIAWEMRNPLSAIYTTEPRNTSDGFVVLTVVRSERPDEAANRLDFLAAQALALAWGDVLRLSGASKSPRTGDRMGG